MKMHKRNGALLLGWLVGLINAQREATDYKHLSRKVRPDEKLGIHLAPGGG